MNELYISKEIRKKENSKRAAERSSLDVVNVLKQKQEEEEEKGEKSHLAKFRIERTKRNCLPLWPNHFEFGVCTRTRPCK